MIAVIVRVLAAAVTGLALALSFPPYGFWLLAPVSVAGLALTVAGRRPAAGFGYGFVSGFVFFAVLVRWLTVVGNDAWLMLSAYSALWIGLIGWGTVVLMRLPGWPIWVAMLWVAVEAVRDRVPLGGWPWGRLGFGQSDSPLLNLAWLGGVPLLTLAVALSGSLLAGSWVAWRTGRPDHAIPGLAGGLAVLLVGLVIPLPTDGEGRNGPAFTTIAVVQGNVPETGLDFNAQRRAVLENHVRATLKLAADVDSGKLRKPQAVIWPENSSDIDPYRNPDAAALIDQAATAMGVPILVGAVVANPEDPKTLLNLGIVWNPETGPGETYAKQHPVPFGEYIPFREFLAQRIDRFDQIPKDFAAGDQPGVLPVGPVRVGDIICFEVAYDDLIRETVAEGGRMIVVQTNNATYTGSGQTEQQLAMARIRAVEHGRTVAVAATNGLSALFAPDGSEIGRIGERQAGTIVSDVVLRDSLSPAASLGRWPEVIVLAGVLGLIVLALRSPARVWPKPGQVPTVAASKQVPRT